MKTKSVRITFSWKNNSEFNYDVHTENEGKKTPKDLIKILSSFIQDNENRYKIFRLVQQEIDKNQDLLLKKHKSKKQP